MPELADFWTDLDAIEAEKWKWLEGPRITFDDVNNGSERIQKCSAKEWFNPKSEGASSGGRSGGKPPSNVMAFGKYRGRLLADIREEDPGYWAWACRDIDGFAAKARKAGLLDEEEDAA